MAPSKVHLRCIYSFVCMLSFVNLYTGILKVVEELQQFQNLDGPSPFSIFFWSNQFNPLLVREVGSSFNNSSKPAEQCDRPCHIDWLQISSYWKIGLMLQIFKYWFHFPSHYFSLWKFVKHIYSNLSNQNLLPQWVS